MKSRSGKPRVACLLQMFALGGMPKWLFNLASGLGDRYEFFFIATHSRDLAPEYRAVARTVWLPPRLPILAAYLWWQRIDIAQVANLRLYTEAALKAQVPVIIERTDGIRSGAALSPKQGLDAVIASTRGTIPALSKLIEPSRIHLIYNGIDLERQKEIVPERFGFEPEDVIVGRVSRLAGGKNISLLIQAVMELRRDPAYERVRLVVCGGDTRQKGAEPMMDRLKAEAAPLGSSAVFTGEVFDPWPIIAGFDIATCTSRPNNEGIPNSLLEPMALAKPVVATAVDDIPELVQEGIEGLLVQDQDLEGLVAGLKKLVDRPELRQRMGRAGQEKIGREFEMKSQVAKYARLYDHLLKEKAGR